MGLQVSIPERRKGGCFNVFKKIVVTHSGKVQFTVRKKMATGTFTHNALCTKTLKSV